MRLKQGWLLAEDVPGLALYPFKLGELTYRVQPDDQGELWLVHDPQRGGKLVARSLRAMVGASVFEPDAAGECDPHEG